MENLNKVVLIILFVLSILFFIPIVENQTGALIQLYAKGPQDSYLTGDWWKYDPWFGGSYGNYIGYYPYYRSRFGNYWPIGW